MSNISTTNLRIHVANQRENEIVTTTLGLSHNFAGSFKSETVRGHKIEGRRHRGLIFIFELTPEQRDFVDNYLTAVAFTTQRYGISEVVDPIADIWEHLTAADQAEALGDCLDSLHQAE